MLTLIKGDATEPWPLESNSLDSVVTDPPYGISFMGKSWDDKGGPAAYQEWTTLWAKEAYRCLKPGGFLLAFGATRMAHRMTCGFEDVGFEILDTVEWLYLSGMPKAQDIGKLFDKRAGVERAIIGKNVHHRPNHTRGDNAWRVAEGRKASPQSQPHATAPATDLAKQWDGWKTPSLKPAHEPIVVARKPLIGTYCENIERWGVGAINVEACRVSGVPEATRFDPAKHNHDGWRFDATGMETAREAETRAGRFPANVVMSHGPDCTEETCQEGCPVQETDGQSGHLSKGRFPGHQNRPPGYTGGWGNDLQEERNLEAGGASKVFAKFFWEEDDYVPFRYCPKASKSERDAGCENLPSVAITGQPSWLSDNGVHNQTGKLNRQITAHNYHPTVKPVNLIRYLQRLVTPPGGMTASPFLGSGTDAIAAIREGFNFWGMNLPDRPGEEYWPIIEARVTHALKEKENPTPKKAKAPKATLEVEPKTNHVPMAVGAEQMRLF